MSFIGNLLWIVFGGFFIAVSYFLGGIACCLTIIGIPFGVQCFKLSGIACFPFGKEVVQTEGKSGVIAAILNVIWLLFFGLEIAIMHLILAGLLAITIIGIPFARQHLKLIALALFPFGKSFKG
ncbi:MAG: YccF domain-containing protein [Candidatus Omnitrophica bacterium]|nr:YccF domain-containing protein [Candidatus Omnitrophota bacterium]